MSNEIANLATSLWLTIPQHVGMHLEHNPHKLLYEKSEDYIDSHDMKDDFQSVSDYEASVATDQLWVIHWYPNTPVGFNRICAPSLRRLLELMTVYNESLVTKNEV